MSKFSANMDDETNSTLYFARNEYYIGNFMGSINSVLSEQSVAEAELLSYMYMSYLAMGSGRLIANDISENDSTSLLALRQLYEALEDRTKEESTLNSLIDKIVLNESSNLWRICAAILYCHCKQYENALKVLNNSDNLESMAMCVQCMLSLNRSDLARKVVSKMQEKNDDATLTQLSQAWIAMSCGGEQLQDAFHIYQEFREKYQPTPMMLNGQAVCHIGQDRYEEAESVLRQVLTKNFNDYDALINIMVLSHLIGKDADVISRYLEQLKQFHPGSEFLRDLETKSFEFDHLCLQYSER